MRNAYIILGVAWLIVIAIGVYAFNHRFMSKGDTGTEISHATSTSMMSSTLSLTSTAFSEGASIPSKYTCDGEQVHPADGGVNPPLSISGVPAEAKSLALIMDDLDVPKQLRPDGVFNHWTLFNIPPQTTEIATGVTIGVPGANGAGKNTYAGPCPPPQYQPNEHRYTLTLYALDQELPLKAGASKADVLQAMQGHILAQAQLIGKYKRQ